MHTFNCECNIASDPVLLSVVLVAGCTLERVDVVHHIFSDIENISLYDSSTDQLCPVIRRLWISFC